MKNAILLLAGLLAGIGTMAQELTTAEQSTLLRMYEEEKMAKEVYAALDQTWDQQVFRNITAAESTHMQKVKEMAATFGLDSRLPNHPAGRFSDNALQAMYDELVAQGRVSLEAALRAGARIEETDIADLEKAIAATTNPQLQSAYRYLVAASENHLRAFVRNLRRLGKTYQPLVLDQQRYNKIARGGQGPGRQW